MLLSAMLLTGVSLVSCSQEKEPDIWNGNMKPVEISFDENGEPVLKHAFGVDEGSFEESVKGRIAYLKDFMIVNSDGSCTTSIPEPMLYGISNPQLYFKDKEHLIFFNEEDGNVKQYKQIGVTINFKGGTVFRSEGKYVGQFCAGFMSSRFHTAVLYYGEQNGKPVYVKVVVKMSFIVPESYPDGLDKL